MVSPEILCHYSKGFSPWHFRKWSRRKLLKTCSSSAAPGRVISLSVPAGAFPMSFQFLSLINYYCASLCPKDELCHAWHLPDLVLAGGTLFSRYRSGVWSSSLFLQWPFSKTEQLSILQYFFFPEPLFCSLSSRFPSFSKCSIGPDMPPQETRYKSSRVNHPTWRLVLLFLHPILLFALFTTAEHIWLMFSLCPEQPFDPLLQYCCLSR